MSLALATHRLPSEWQREDPTDVLTALVLLEQQADDLEEARRGR